MIDALPRTIVVASLALTLLAAGCGGGQGRSFERCGSVAHNCRPVSDSEARAEERSARADWLHESGYHGFAAPRLRSDLRRAARTYSFRVLSVHGTVVVIESDDYTRIAHAIPQLVKDVHARSYPAYFLEVVDSRHVPYIAVFDSLRGHVMGGQWARADDLYPFAHG